MELVPGQKVGEYEIVGRLGAGAMGVVYAARHPVIGKKVAIKVLNQEFAKDQTVVRRFIAEARAVNEIGHPHIVDIFAFGTLPGEIPYFVMEHLPGQSLGELLQKRGRLQPGELVAVLGPVAEAVDMAHAHGIIHRDLKPDNVFIVDLPGGGHTVKVLDFGVAKLVSSNATATKGPIGTPLFMAPEQCLAQDIDHRVDVYAFGVIAFNALTQAYPVAADSLVQFVSMHLQKTPPRPPSAFGAPSFLDGPILSCLSHDPTSRPGSLADAHRLLARAVEIHGGQSQSVGIAATAAAPLRSGPPPSTVPPPLLSSPQARPAAPTVQSSTLGHAAGERIPTSSPQKRTGMVALGIAGLVTLAVASGTGAYFALSGSDDTGQSAATSIPDSDSGSVATASPTANTVPPGTAPRSIEPDVSPAPASAGTVKKSRSDEKGDSKKSKRRRPTKTGRDRSKIADTLGKEDCWDEVACMLQDNPPTCCKKYKKTKTSKPVEKKESVKKCDAVACLVDPSLPCCESIKREPTPSYDPNLSERPSRTDISSGIGKVRGRVQSCGDEHGFKGTVTVKITIIGSGKVLNAKANKGSGAFKSCVKSAVKKAKFKKTQKGITVNYPFVFR